MIYEHSRYYDPRSKFEMKQNVKNRKEFVQNDSFLLSCKQWFVFISASIDYISLDT